MTRSRIICRHRTGTATALSVTALLLASAAPTIAQQLDLDALARDLDRIEAAEPASDGQAPAGRSGPLPPVAPPEFAAPMPESDGAADRDAPATPTGQAAVLAAQESALAQLEARDGTRHHPGELAIELCFTATGAQIASIRTDSGTTIMSPENCSDA